MKFLDRFLPLWIFLSMFIGLFLGVSFPQIVTFYSSLEFQDINLAIALGLIIMMYPPLAIVMFSYKGESLITLPLDVLLVALPLVAYFIIMFFISFDKSKGFGYAKCSAVSFSACGNNFELSLAVAIASFGIDSGQAFASIVGVLIEVPIMITLASWLKRNRWAST